MIHPNPMKRFSFLLLLCVFVALLPEAYGQTSKKSGSLSDIGFIEGHWKATPQGSTVEAIWSAPAGDNMVGVIRMMKDSKATLYEMFAFEQTNQGLVALVKHFQPGLIGLEEKDQSDRYHFLEAGKGRAIFKKQGEDLRVLYEKRSDDQFAIVLGKPQEGQWVYKDFWVFNRVK